MVQKLALMIAVVAFAVGCGGPETPAPQDPPAVKASVESSAQQAWTAEKQEAYRSAMQRARSGDEGKGSMPQSSTPGPVNSSGPSYDNPDAGPATPTYDQTTNQSSSVSQPSTTSRPPSGRPDDVGTTGSDPMVGK